jgi:uncharacterized protein (TIGR02001 family)
MRKLSVFGATVALASASFGSIAAGEAESPHVFSANVTLATDYMFRGISRSGDGPAIQGGIDWQYKPVGLYAGVWASNVELNPINAASKAVNNRASMELDIYGGFAGTLPNGIGWDVGGIIYTFPGNNEDSKLFNRNTGQVTSSGAEYDYQEAYFKTSYAFKDAPMSPTVKGGVYVSPDYFGEDGTSVYGFGTVGVTAPYGIGVAVTLGYLTVEGDEYSGTPALDGYEYVHYSVGLSKSLGKLNFNLSWNDSDKGCGELTGNEDGICNGVVFAVSSLW